jgi:homoserine dehydrogenase
MSEVRTSYYLRLQVLDQPGVLADITRILADRSISIEAFLQKEPRAGQAEADIVVLTHQTLEKHVDAAIASIEALATVLGRVTRIRVEALG